MRADWVANLLAPLIALLLSALLGWWLERRPRLVAYFSNANAFTLGAQPAGPPPAQAAPDPPGAQPAAMEPVTIHTHGIVIRNAGRRAATDVRVRHHVLPVIYRVFPVTNHTVEHPPGGGAEIVFPTLVPREQVAISYLYFPPLLANQIHSGIRCAIAPGAADVRGWQVMSR